MTVTPSPLLLTLGYGKRSIAEVIELLQRHEIRFLVDVRSAPWSRYHADFSQNALKEHVQAHDIAYLFLGEELGGRPADPDCYDEAGHTVYDRCRQRPAFQRGIQRLRASQEQGQRVALLCSESRPQDCHRSKLVGRALAEVGVTVTHLDDDDSMVNQSDVIARLSEEPAQLPLFGDVPAGTLDRSRGRYRPSDQ